jgi:tetratricopeptide (TPR) repeat protein
MKRLHAALVPCLALLACLACASSPETDPRYAPTENVLEVVAVLRRHVPDDTYRFEPARDFTGRNVYRSSLLRLENVQSRYEHALRAGHFDGVIAFAKGRALERLRAFDLAADAYRIAAERDSELRVEALASADVCTAIVAARSTGPELEELAAQAAADGRLAAEIEDAVRRFDAHAGALETLARSVEGTHYAYVMQEEIERVDVARADYFGALRRLLPDGDVRAAAERQRVAMRHRDSKLAPRHLLALAGLYADLAQEYVDANPPESLRFDPARFQELIDTAARVYEMVATRDGTPEKLEASRKLEAFLAFALSVDRDRFTP